LVREHCAETDTCPMDIHRIKSSKPNLKKWFIRDEKLGARACYFFIPINSQK
jgi:hypothetical protein